MDNDYKITGLMEQLEKGVNFFFNSEHYIDYLNVIGRFHDYSMNNQMLIAMQNPDATYVAGYVSWQKNFERHVRKGEKGIVILAPRKKMRLIEDMDENGNIVKDYKEYITFRPTYVYDVSQTEGKELPSLVKMLEGKIEKFDDYMQAVAFASPFPINIMEMNGSANGICNFTTETINIKAGMSELQTIKTAVHEVAHARVHNGGTFKDRAQKEVEAESIAYTVCSYLGLDTSDYSFGYVAGWAGDKNVELLKGCLETIRKESIEIIEVVEKYMDERTRDIDGVSIPQIEEMAEIALNDSIAELGMNSRVISARFYGIHFDGDYKAAKVMVQYKGSDREDTLFNEVNKEAVSIGGVTIDVNPINENKSGDIDSYYRQVKTWEKEDMTDDSWPMVNVAYSNCQDLPVGKINIYEAEKSVSRAEKRLSGEGNTSVVRIELEYTYAGEKKKISDRIFLGEGRSSLINSLNISEPEKLYMRRHIQLLETIQQAKDEPISAGTIYQERYEDMIHEWAEKQRLELNYNTEPMVERPPSLRPELVKQHEEWEMIR